jgi:pimeloyl-ACP methyl ester carboxylesterase/DNA-binding CsgD family transcriptional regulator
MDRAALKVRLVKQRIRYTHSKDGTALAWARAGEGPPLVKASNWLTHLEYDLESPVWSHWVRFFADHFDFVRFDERGCGLSEQNPEDLSFERWIEDLEAVVEAAEIDQPMILLGVSQGAAAVVAYAARHPERVAQIILYGGYAQGWKARGDPQGARLYDSLADIIEVAWEQENPVFRELFTKRFIPAGSEEQVRWFNELCRKTVSAQMASRLVEARSTTDVSDLLDQVELPALVLNCDRDEVVPLSQGKILARGLPNAEFIELESRNHIVLKHEPAWARIKEAVLDFTSRVPSAAGLKPNLAGLSRREREILEMICAAKSNPEIAAALKLSERTVRNHASNIFKKLGVKSRAEAMLYAGSRR